ncbi:O-linked N-acetylglucosamine transferase [Ameyamaea chiangmaiensis NBRC 103196]|nr:O-linked N-acetylglucosamine transferase [Ameyamaea chiangmaiensis NBRC 103196]
MLSGLGDVEQAAQLAVRLADAAPDQVHPGHSLIETMGALDRRPAAEAVLRRVVELSPHDPRGLEALATVLVQTGRFEEALHLQQSALARNPHNQNVQLVLASMLSESGRYDEAIAILKRLCDRYPNNIAAHANLACLYTAVGAMDDALAIYRVVLPMAPQDPRIRLNHSIGLLKAGRFAQGWSEHEWRLQLPGHTTLPRATLLPNVTASLDLAAKRVLVTHEEGLGDTLMYLRYVPELARRGAVVTVMVPPALQKLAERVDGVARVWTESDAPDFDYHCPFISLPRALAVTGRPLGDPVPYLRADPALVATWEKRLSVLDGLRVGLVWSGAPRPTQTIPHMIDRKRSIPLETLRPLSGLPGIDLVSLQLGPPRDQIAALEKGFTLLDPMDDVNDMNDTAALMMALDLVVSVDTSSVHLAGGLGLPVLMLDRLDHCWRWPVGQRDSQWYPHMEIFRQTRLFDWKPVVRRVCERVRAIESSSAAPI